MICTNNNLLDFWCTPWSEPLRRANIWLERFGQPIIGKQPDKKAPRWVRPLCVQRWVGQAIAERLAWMAEHPERTDYRYGKESEPCWDEVAWQRYDWRILHQFNDEMLLDDIFGVEVERLLRIMQEHPSLVGQVEWTQATLGASEHVAQVYAELKRRYKAARARCLLREALHGYVTWEREAETASDSEPAAPEVTLPDGKPTPS
jgi:hypothetical protein